jgi:paraquat-inducible protein A
MELAATTLRLSAPAPAALRRVNAGAAVVSCPDCGARQTVDTLVGDGAAACHRCGAVVARAGRDRPDRALALALAAVPMFVAASTLPLMRLGAEGAGAVEGTVVGAARALLEQRLPSLAALVLATTLVLPAARLAGLLYLLLWRRWRTDAPPPALRPVLRVLVPLRSWAQVEILLLGALVAFGKLATVFAMAPGVGLAAMAAALLLEWAAAAAVDPERLWGPARGRSERRPGLARPAAFLVAAAVLYLPANLLPVMTTRTLLSSQTDTIASGVVALWVEGSWPLAILVFAASVVVPVLKILGLALLLVTARLGSAWRRRERTALYRLIEVVGRWSMLDIFVMGLLAAMVRSPMARVEIEAGAVAFAAVVMLTMFASATFDPRALWRNDR